MANNIHSSCSWSDKMALTNKNNKNCLKCSNCGKSIKRGIYCQECRDIAIKLRKRG